MKSLTLVLVFVACNINALAWGNTGHRAIAEIGWKQLSNRTKQKIELILGDSYLPLYATYADNVRSETDNPLADLPHYVNMPLDVTYEASQKNEDGDLVTVMTDMIRNLKSTSSTKEEKAVALKFIIHLVGDAHQPMHVGLVDDLGGNTVDVKWFGEPTNLHHVWDSDLVDFTQLSYTELARFVGTPEPEELESLNNISLIDWIDETHTYTNMIYNNLGSRDFGYEYSYIFTPVVFNQIQKAGYRLGNLLNELMKDLKIKDLK